MSAADVEDKSLQYIKQGTGAADAKATGAALKRQAEELSKIGAEKRLLRRKANRLWVLSHRTFRWIVC